MSYEVLLKPSSTHIVFVINEVFTLFPHRYSRFIFSMLAFLSHIPINSSLVSTLMAALFSFSVLLCWSFVLNCSRVCLVMSHQYLNIPLTLFSILFHIRSWTPSAILNGYFHFILCQTHICVTYACKLLSRISSLELYAI